MMYVKIFLVYLTYLAVQCRAQTEPGRQYTALVPSQESRIVYESYPAGTQERQERQLPLYKASRAEDRIAVPLYQYQQEASYTSERQSQESQYQPTYQQYSKVNGPNHIRQTIKQQPTIEQYLKEVTPTTKTAYDPAYHQPSTQQIETQGPILKQSPFQFVLQSESHQVPQQTYEVTIPKKATQNIIYENALLAKPSYEQQRPIEYLTQSIAPSKSPVYYTQRAPQKSSLKKVPSPPKATSLEAELEYYTKLQEYQQQFQPKPAYESKQLAPIKYQVRVPQYTKTESQQEEQIVYLPYQPRFGKSKARIPVTEAKHNAEQPQYQQQINYQPLEEEYQNINPELYQYQPVPAKEYQQVPVKDLVQYQPAQVQKYKGGPKYLPEPSAVKYQQPVPQIAYRPESHSDLESFRAQLAKIEQQQNLKPRPAARPVALVQSKPQYVTEQDQSRYQLQPVVQPQPQPQPQPQAQSGQNSQYDSTQFSQQSREEYEKLKKQLEEDPDPKTEFVKALGNNSSLRLYKGRPVVFVGQGA